jgi:hypothetical protein
LIIEFINPRYATLLENTVLPVDIYRGISSADTCILIAEASTPKRSPHTADKIQSKKLPRTTANSHCHGGIREKGRHLLLGFQSVLKKTKPEMNFPV